MCRHQCPKGGLLLVDTSVLYTSHNASAVRRLLSRAKKVGRVAKRRYDLCIAQTCQPIITRLSGIGVYTSFFTLPPGGSSDSEGRAAASPVLLFRCLDTSHTSSCRLTFLELIRNTQFVCNRSANNDRARFVVNGIGDFLVMVRLLSSLACLRPSPLVTSRPSRREGECSTIPIVLSGTVQLIFTPTPLSLSHRG